MRTKRRFHALIVAVVSSSALLAATPGALAEPMQPLADPGVVPDDMLTLVVGTRFVSPTDEEATARAQFTGARIPLSAFNETDHCVDQQVLEVAKEYFTNLGRVLGKAGHYYFVPETEIRKSVSMCERLHHLPPKAWVDKKTRIIAFGRVVPTVDAPALERSVR